MNNAVSIHILDLKHDLQIAYTGPHISSGPLPALFYFSRTAEESLQLDPFNQPVAYLAKLPMRVFSLTLPGHENGLPPTEAIGNWAQAIAQGRNIVAEFIENVQFAVERLLEQNVLIPKRIGVAGLSRGGFLATHAAAHISHFRFILGFAPMTQLSFAKEFQEIAQLPIVQSLSLEQLIPRLIDRTLRFYIGNLDTLVSTSRCFHFIEKLAQTAFEHRVRVPQVELIISPSMGRFGHGTSTAVFHEGAQWIAERLGAVDVM